MLVGPVGQAPGGHQPAEHVVRGEAPHRPQVHRRRTCRRTSTWCRTRSSQPTTATRGSRRPRARRWRRRKSPRAVLAKMKKTAEDYLGEDGDRSGHHRAGVLQRLAAPGDQGRRPHRGPRRQAHHQRADRGRARLWPRQVGRRSQDRRVRPGRRHVRRVDHRDRRSRRRAPVRSAVDQRRHVPRWRRLRQAHHRLPRRRVPEGIGRRPAQGSARAAAPEGRRREGQDRAVVARSRPT